MSFARVLDNLALEKSTTIAAVRAPARAQIGRGVGEAWRRSRSRSPGRTFGRTMRLFAPLYLSNECINNCRYCGFSRDNPILRVTLELEQVVAEARHLAAEGFRQILLVAGEHPKFVSGNYLADCVRALAPDFSSIAIEVGPMETDGIPCRVVACRSGRLWWFIRRHMIARSTRKCTPPVPSAISIGGLDCPERGYEPAFAVSALARFSVWLRGGRKRSPSRRMWNILLKRCWQAQISVSLPRLRPAAGGFEPRFTMTDRELAQLICAFRITFPAVRHCPEHARARIDLRDALIPLGITMMSAGSHTEPGGYTGQGTANLHMTVRGQNRRARIPGRPRSAWRPANLKSATNARRLRSRPLCAARFRASLERLGSGAARLMKVWLNGENADARGAGTVAELADRYGLHPNSILIEHNGVALHQREWAERPLAEADRVEFIRVVAGRMIARTQASLSRRRACHRWNHRDRRLRGDEFAFGDNINHVISEARFAARTKCR